MSFSLNNYEQAQEEEKQQQRNRRMRNVKLNCGIERRKNKEFL